MNPLSKIPYFLTYTEELTSPQKRRVAYVTALSTFIVCLVSILLGYEILEIFGIGMSSFKIGGGILLLFTGIAMANSKSDRELHGEHRSFSEVISIAIVPLSIPLTAGPGTISTVILYSKDVTDWMHALGLFVVVLVSSAIVYITLRASSGIQRVLGETGMNVMTRIMGLIILSIAVQFVTDGLGAIFTNLVK
jgi:multiple antibiotic resistance protein